MTKAILKNVTVDGVAFSSLMQSEWFRSPKNMNELRVKLDQPFYNGHNTAVVCPSGNIVFVTHYHDDIVIPTKVTIHY